MFHRPPTPHAVRQPNFLQRDALSPAHAVIHRAVERCYEDFIELLELTHDEASEFIELLTGYQATLFEHDQRRNGSADCEIHQQFRKHLKAQLDQCMQTLIGAARFWRFEDYRIGLLLKPDQPGNSHL